MDFGIPPQGSRRSYGRLKDLSRARLANESNSGTIEQRRFLGPVAVTTFQNQSDHHTAHSRQHPRLLFTAEDIPRLRASAETERGQGLIKRLTELLQFAESNGFNNKGAPSGLEAQWAVGHGLLYHLTGDQYHAERAGNLIWQSMTGALADGHQHKQAGRILGTALAYDLCYPAWDREIRSQTYHFLLRQALHFTNRRDIADPLAFGTRYDYQGETIPRPKAQSSHQFHRYVMAAGLGAEAIRFDPPPTLTVPSLSHIETIEPAHDYAPPIGVPIVRLTSGQLFHEWLANGPFPASDPDPLNDVGGFSLRPAPTELVSSLGVNVDWRIFRPSAIGGRGPTFYPRNDMRYFTSSTGAGYPPGLRIMQQLKQQRKDSDSKAPTPIALTWYTVWDNRDDRMIMAQPNWEWPSRGIRMFINGTEVTDGDIFYVTPGLYPVMCWVPVRGGYNLQAPNLREVSKQELLQEYPEFDYRGMRLDPQANEQEGFIHYLAEALSEQTRIHIEHTVDTAGYGFHHSTEFLLPFATAMLNAQQRDWLSGTGFDRVVEQLAITVPYVEQLASARLLNCFHYYRPRVQRNVGSSDVSRISPTSHTGRTLGDMPAIRALREKQWHYLQQRLHTERVSAERRAISRGKPVDEALADIRQPLRDLPLDLVMSFLWLENPESHLNQPDEEQEQKQKQQQQQQEQEHPLTNYTATLNQPGTFLIARPTQHQENNHNNNGDIVVALHTGNGPTVQPLNALQISMWGKNGQGQQRRAVHAEPFFLNHAQLSQRDYLATSPMVEGLVPATPAQIIAQQQFGHHATSVAMKVTSWQALTTDSNGKQILHTHSSPHRQTLQRSILVDYHDDDHISAVIIVADTFSGFPASTKKWQQWHGGSNTAHHSSRQDMNRAVIRLFTGEDRVTIRDKFVLPKQQREAFDFDNFYYLQGQALSDKAIGVRLFQQDEGQRRGCLRFAYDDQAGSDQPGGSFNDLSGLEDLGFGDEDLLALDSRQRTRRPSSPDHYGMDFTEK